MRRTELLAAVTLTCVLTIAAVGQAWSGQQDELQRFAWLEGEWQHETRRGISIERWSRIPGGGLVGESVGNGKS